MRRVLLVAAPLLVAVAAVESLMAQPPSAVCVVIHDVAAGRTSSTGDRPCTTRLAPASTYKIPHALIALETGVVTTASVERWDGTPYPGRTGWTRDHTVISALKPSALWVFQRIAPRVSAARAHEWLTRLSYGNADTSGPVTDYWLNGRLRISPDEQVAFLREVFGGATAFAPAHVEAVRAGLVQQPGTVENSTGVHSLGVTWHDAWTLEAKTGATRMADGTGVSWLVGRWTVDGRAYVFAGAAWRAGEVDTLDGTRAVVRAFRDRGIVR